MKFSDMNKHCRVNYGPEISKENFSSASALYRKTVLVEELLKFAFVIK